ncbi:MAG: prepilin-type N-terminal cleavage/methylation domain-containing protein [Verrucomicrobia bacterium]|nr:prepilin-type N-terminal cleavage/methylation domain-containing protein [Verrucomicrobiota bacterium]
MRTDVHRMQGQSGLTLIEIMLALTIVAIGLVTLLTAASRCIAVARSAKIYENARHMLGRVELENPIRWDEVEEGAEQGYFDGNSDFTWQRTIEQIGEEEDPLFLVSTRVIWSERGKESYEEVVTYMFVPEALDDE